MEVFDMNAQNEISGNQPEKRFSTGAISASVWQNEGKNKNGEAFSYQTVNLQRRYKDKDGNWQSTSTLRLNDLPKAQLVLGKAYEHIVLRDNGAAIVEEQVI